jgi:hypothetical protein
MKEYQKYKVLSSGITATRLHKYTYGQSGGTADIRFAAVKGGIAFPTDKSPFHAVVVGQEYIDLSLYAITEPEFELLYEVTDHGLDLEARHNKLADIADLYKANFYADLSGINEAAAEGYRGFKSKHSYAFGSLLEAPYSGNIRLGVELLKSHVKNHTLDIPKHSPAFEQLSRITEADLGEPDVMQKFFCIESLRHVMCSYKRDPGGPSPILSPGRIRYSEHGWMQ